MEPVPGVCQGGCRLNLSNHALFLSPEEASSFQHYLLFPLGFLILIHVSSSLFHEIHLLMPNQNYYTVSFDQILKLA